eukprot:TRINITY_DN2192_c0_g1_i8.p3 TRINITY_DN2192_c0_g1~~TRINITY_DN2192_c0_g1_i8.p3  ORF type:complete len:113 (+),score=22.25 TRINITY_DN2192_c0_g1_i8:325-663(+)
MHVATSNMHSKAVTRRTAQTTPTSKQGILFVSDAKSLEADKTVTATKASSLNGVSRQLLKAGGLISMRTLNEEDCPAEEEFACQVVSQEVVRNGLQLDLQVCAGGKLGCGCF